VLEPLKICSYCFDWYWIIVAPTIILAVMLFIINLKKWSINISFIKSFFVGATIVSSGFWGAKIASLLELYILSGTTPNIDILGSRLYGSIVGGLLSCVIIAKLFQVNEIYKILDSLAITAAICFAIGKIGCFLSGHPGCYGVETSLPWGIEFAYNGQSIGYFAHPIQLYDSAFYALFYILIVKFSKKNYKEGSTFILFMLLISGYSILIEFIRDNQLVIGFFTLAQITYTVILMALLLLLYKRNSITQLTKSS
jgi:prolipoprotein diacylglyceryltransferase